MDRMASRSPRRMDGHPRPAGDAEGDLPRLVGEERQNMIAAREQILNRIRAAKGASSPADAATAYAGIERSYQSVAELSRSAILHLFEERLRDYDANVYRTAASEAGATVAEILRSRNIHRVLVPQGLPAEWQRG